MKIDIKKGKWLTLFLFAVSFVFLSGCKKDPDKVGAGIIQASGKLNVSYTDTITVIAHSLRVDSVRSDEGAKSLLGSFNDPVFGKTTSSFYSQFRLPNKNQNFGSNPQVDSVILTMMYSGYYGDTTTPLRVHAYEMSAGIYRDSVYFSNYSGTNYGIDLTDYFFYPRPASPVYLGEDTLTARLRLNLSRFTTELGDKILNADSTALSDNDNFLEYFYGLYLTVDEVQTGGSVIYFDLLSNNSNLTVYYRNDSTDSLSYQLMINENCARVNNFNHYGYQSSDPAFAQQVLNGDTALGAEILYIQANGGVKTIIEFPYVSEWFNTGKIIVNEAALIIPAKGIETVFKVPVQLGLLQIDSAGTTHIMDDEFEGAPYFGGAYDSTANSYRFRISTYIQELMMKKFTGYGLSLYIHSPSITATRLIMQGTSPTAPEEKRLKLELRYSELK